MIQLASSYGSVGYCTFLSLEAETHFVVWQKEASRYLENIRGNACVLSRVE